VSYTPLLITAIAVGIVCIATLAEMPQPSKIETANSQQELDKRIAVLDPGAARITFALRLDCLFIAAYVTAIGLGCHLIARDARGFWQPTGRFLAYAQIASGLVDAIENAALLILLHRGFDPQIMGAARFATAVKFYVPVAGTIYIVIAAIFGRR
jgi:hypothetical protein